MELLDYIGAGDNVSAARMNAIFGALDDKLETMLGGRSLVLSLKYPNTLPPQIFGKPFFFNDSRCVYYSATFPDAVQYTVTVTDPVTLSSVNGIGVRSYSQSSIDAIIQGVSEASFTYDSAKKIATIPLIASGSYPAGITQATGISLFQHSLKVITKLKDLDDGNGVQRYYVKEQSPGMPTVKFDEPFPERRSDYGVAEIVIENLQTVTLPADWPKYRFYRFHNLSETACAVNLFGAPQVTLEPFEQRCIRYDFTADKIHLENPREGMRYFFTWEAGDPLMFWFFGAAASSRDVHGQYVISDRSTTPEASMQGNNICSPAGVYDLIRYLSDTSNHCHLEIDPHELCDIAETYYGKFDAIRRTGEVGNYTYDINPEKLVGDLLFHTGTLKLAKTRKATPFDVTFTDFTFRGFTTIVDDFAAVGITVEQQPNGDLKLYVESSTADNFDFNWDLIGTQCNLLLDKSFIGGNRNEAMLRSAVRLDEENGGFTIDAFVFEQMAGITAAVDPLGSRSFNRAKESNYRITQRSSTTTTPTRAWINPAGQSVNKSGAPTETIAEVALTVPAKSFTGYLLAYVNDLLNLSHFGNPTSGGQSDSVVTFYNPQIKLTPEGPVLIFTERVRADALPTLTSTSYRSVYTPAGRSYTFNATDNVFEFKHAIRFRKHGFGYGQHGKNNAAFFPPHNGRMIVKGWRNTGSNANGADFTIPSEKRTETGIKTLRQVALYGGDYSEGPYELFPLTVHELDTLDGRFFTLNSPVPLDGLVDAQFTAEWYRTNRNALTGDDYPAQFGGHRSIGGTKVVFLTLSAEHINGIIQAINQIKSCRVLDYKAAVFVVGNKYLSFDPSFVPFDGSFNGRPVATWQSQFGTTLPAPMDALMARGDNTYWPSFLASRNIPEATSATVGALPASWSTYRTAFNQDRAVTSVCSGSISGCSNGGAFQIADFGGTWWVYRINGTMTWSLTDPAIGAASNVSQGLASVFPLNSTAKDPIGAASSVTVALNTAYGSKRWLRASDLRAFFAAIGFPFVWQEAVTPLKLEFLDTPTTLETGIAGKSLSVSYTGQVSVIQTAGQTVNQPNPPTGASVTNSINQIIAIMNATTGSQSATLATLRSRSICFRLAEDETEAEWKLATATTAPVECYHLDNRTIGRHWTRSPYLTPGFFGPLGRHPAAQVSRIGTTAGMHFDSSSLFGGGNSTLQNYTTTAPFFPASNSVTTYPQPGESYSTSNSAFTIARMTAGPRQFYELSASADEGTERLYQGLNNETRWHSIYIVASSGISPQMQVAKFGFRTWGEVKDFRSLSADNQLTGKITPDTAQRYVEPAECNAASNGVTTVTAGVTVFKPNRGEAFNLLFDPLKLQVAF